MQTNTSRTPETQDTTCPEAKAGVSATERTCSGTLTLFFCRQAGSKSFEDSSGLSPQTKAVDSLQQLAWVQLCHSSFSATPNQK